MARLSNERRAQVLKLLTEGVGINATVRITGIAKTTVLRLLAEAGRFAQVYQHCRLRGLGCRRIEADEIWSFVGAKEKNARQPGHGTVWTFTAIDPETKLLVTWAHGQRVKATARAFVQDIADRVARRIQLTTDGHDMYVDAVRRASGHRIDYAQLVKDFTADPPRIFKRRMIGNPDPALISTSLVERANLAMRTQMRRFTWKTMGFSHTLENHAHSVAITFLVSNFALSHGTLTRRYGTRTTPAMAAGLETGVWSMLDLTRRMDATREIAA